MNPVKSARMWARTLVEAVRQGMAPPPEILAGFARDYQQLAEHAGLHMEAAATMLERRAEHRGGEMVRVHLLAAASDIRAGLHMEDEGAPATPILHRHADGDEYILVGSCVVKDDQTGEWVDSVCYRAAAGPRAGVLCVTSQQRWDDRFEPPVETPDVAS